MTPTGDRELDALLNAAAAPPLPGRGDRGLDAVLEAYRAAGHVGPAAGDGPAEQIRIVIPPRPRRAPGRRFAVACAVVTAGVGVVMAGANAGVLPTPVQSLAHDVLGGVGVPAPPTRGSGPGTGRTPTASTGASATPRPSRTPSAHATGSARPSASWGSGSGTHATTDPITALCTQIANTGDEWRERLGPDDQAVLIAAAGGDDNVEPYCVELLGGTPPAQSFAPERFASNTPSTRAATATTPPDGGGHGRTRPTHGPGQR
jgi:hypothetical protein